VLLLAGGCGLSNCGIELLDSFSESGNLGSKCLDALLAIGQSLVEVGDVELELL